MKHVIGVTFVHGRQRYAICRMRYNKITVMSGWFHSIRSAERRMRKLGLKRCRI